MAFSFTFPTEESIPLVQGDTRPVLNFTIVDNQEPPVAINLTGHKVSFNFKKKTSATYKFKRELLHIDDPNGRVGLNWVAGDLAESGAFQGEVEIVFPNGTIQTQAKAFTLIVRPQLDAFTPPYGQPMGTPNLPAQEDLSSQINGSQTTFTTTWRFIPGTLRVFKNGLYQGVSGGNFTENSTSHQAFTMNFGAPIVGDELIVDYIVEGGT
jgi:hypothetical protein